MGKAKEPSEERDGRQTPVPRASQTPLPQGAGTGGWGVGPTQRMDRNVMGGDSRRGGKESPTGEGVEPSLKHREEHSPHFHYQN